MHVDVLFNLVLVLLAAWLFGALASRLGYPAILGEIAAGVILGPPMLGWLHESDELHILAEIGVFLLLLYIGMEINYKDLFRVSKASLAAAFAGFFLPCMLGVWGLSYFGYSQMNGLIIGLVMGVTSLTVLSRIMVDLELLNTRMSNIMIAGSLIADTLGLIVFGMILSLQSGEGAQAGKIVLAVVQVAIFFVVVFYLGLKVFPIAGRFLKQSGFTERKANFTLLVVIGLVFAVLAEMAGLHAILGAFLAGLFMRGEVLMRKLSHEVTHIVHDLSLGFLAPIFFVMAGFHVKLGALLEHWPLLLLVLALGFVGKTVGTALLCMLDRRGWREPFVIGLGMNIHGAVEIIIAEIALEEKLIESHLFSIIVVTAVITTALVPVCLKWGVKWLKKHGQLARSDEDRKGVIIVGAGALSRMMAKTFAETDPVWLIDRNVNRCRAAEAEGLNVVRGSGLDEDTLDILEAGQARIFLAMTTNEQINRRALHLAHHLFGIPDCFIRSLPEAMPVDGKNGGEDDPMPVVYDANWDMDVWLGRIGQKETSLVEFPIEEDLPMTAIVTRLKHLDILPLVAVQGNSRVIPASLDEMKQGDKVIGIQLTQEAKKESDPFEQLIQKCKILDLKTATTAHDMFKEVSKLLAEVLYMDVDELFRLLVSREEESSTVIVPGLAIPHIILPGKQKTVLLLVRCRDGITFGDPHTQARIAFVIAGTKDERNVHLRLLSAIAQLFQDRAFEDSLLTVEDPEELREVILTTKRRRF